LHKHRDADRQNSKGVALKLSQRSEQDIRKET
jgi:hypothetical protein